VDLVELYGDLPPEKQDRALQRGPRRRVVLATNVAQSSVTVEGVTAVVDSGLARFLRYDASVGLDRLELDWISRASADQRAGRAGRTAPGLCLRLWTEARQRSLAAEDEPEIRRVDLSGALLELAVWGERDPADSRGTSLRRARRSSAGSRCSAISVRSKAAGDCDRTRDVAASSAPRLARLLIEGARLGQGERIALAAALLAERDPFRRERSRRASRSESDVLDRTLALEPSSSAVTRTARWASSCKVPRVRSCARATSSLDSPRAQEWRKIATCPKRSSAPCSRPSPTGSRGAARPASAAAC
jgi:ATP-dependent helicase HrpB